MKSSKKAVIDVQFNWIFILIIGVFILIFFAGIAIWYKDSEERKNAGDVMVKLQTLMASAKMNTRTANIFEVPNIELEFRCNPDECNSYGCASEFEFSGTGISRDTGMEIIFTQERIKSDVLYVWALGWNVPYKAANFLYIGSPGVKYVLVFDPAVSGSKNLAESAHYKLIENTYVEVLKVESSQVGDIKYNNEYLIRYVEFLGAEVNPHSSVVDSGKWDVLHVDGDENSGTVTYSKKGVATAEAAKEFQYIGMPLLIGAIYSETFENYKCNMIKAVLKLRAVNEVYKERTKLLNLQSDPNCRDFYTVSTTDAFDKIGESVADFESIDTGVLFNLGVSTLISTNEDTKRNSCPRLY